MKVLIIGASGLVGSNCYKLLRNAEFSVVGTHIHFSTDFTKYYNASDINDLSNFNIIELKPDIIIHCGALTNVDYCEKNKEESFLKTFVSTQNLVNIAKQIKSKLIYISTDYVFDGSGGPYTETDFTNPINIYGLHKLAAEKYVQKNLSDYLILRVTNVYGDELRNKNFVSRIIKLIETKEQVSFIFPTDQFATPINASDIAMAIAQLISNHSTGIYHLSSTDFYSRSQLLNKIISYFPVSTNIDVSLKSTKLLNQPARRPLLGGLIASKFICENPNFQFSNIDDYLQRKIKDNYEL